MRYTCNYHSSRRRLCNDDCQVGVGVKPVVRRFSCQCSAGLSIQGHHPGSRSRELHYTLRLEPGWKAHFPRSFHSRSVTILLWNGYPLLRTVVTYNSCNWAPATIESVALTIVVTTTIVRATLSIVEGAQLQLLWSCSEQRAPG